MKLNPDFIPHEDFHKGLWLKTKKCPWFFFYETPRNYELPKNNSFYKTVDDDLIELVKLFHSKNIPTTPSCSGHIETKDNNENLYDSLENLKSDMKNGLIFSNPENNRKFYYTNKNFKLPWDKDEFLDEIRKYQKKGVLGFVDKKNIMNKMSNDLPIKKIGNVGLIMTEGNSKKEISKNWKEITNSVKKML